MLRVLPNKHKWQYFRDPKGAAPAKLEASGSGKFIKIASKPNVMTLRAFSFGGNSTSVIGVRQRAHASSRSPIRAPISPTAARRSSSRASRADPAPA